MIHDYIHAHVHCSIGSMADGMAKIDDLFKKAGELKQSALAITDHGTMAGVLDSRKASKKYGVKYIPGIEAYFVDDVNDEKQKRAHIVLLAKNKQGYENLLKINYEGFLHFKYVPVLNKVFPQIDWSTLEKYKSGVICLTACGSGILARDMFRKDAQEEWSRESADAKIMKSAGKLKDIFGDDLYLELQTHSLKKYKLNKKTHEIEKDADGEPIVAVDQEYINRRLMRLAQEMDIKVVGTSDVHYLEKEDAKIHDMLMAINDKKPLSDPNRHRYEVEDFYMKSGQEAFDHFAKLFGKKSAQKICV
jgi:DNA polymerase-3 subunit alpha